MQFDALPSFDRINLSSTFFQATIVLAFAAAHVGAARYLRRPAVRAIAGFWTLFGLSAFLNIFSSWAGAVWQSRELSRALTSLVVACSGASIPYARSAVLSMLRGRSTQPCAREAAYWFVGVALLHAAGVFGLGAAYPDERIFAVGYSRTLILVVALLPAWQAWNAHANSDGSHRGVRLLAVSLTALVARHALSLALGFRVGHASLGFGFEVAALLGETLTVMATGVFSLLAISAEELRFEQAQTAQLKTAQVRLAAGERLESLGRLAARVAHDFNNVLQITMLSSAALRGRVTDTAGIGVLDEMDAANSHGRSLVRQLLDFARPRKATGEACDTRERLAGVGTMIRTLFPPDIALEVDAGSEPLLARVEAPEFEQIAMNLATNARDATPSGGRVRLALSTARVSDDDAAALGLLAGPYVLLTVSDTGQGIAPDHLARIFEPFFTTKGPERGTGLGLSTVHGIARSAGGTVRVSSQIGAGTTFEVYLPRAEPRA